MYYPLNWILPSKRRLLPGLLWILAAGIASLEIARADIGAVVAKFNDAQSPYVLIGSHRGGYLSDNVPNFPENSLAAIERTLASGVEIIEIDVRSTSDGQLVVMHDDTVNRTTNGSGAVSSFSLAQIKRLRLLDPAGVLTDQRVPTLSEVMTLAKNRAMVNLDKLDVTNPSLMAAAMKVLRRTATVDHAIFKGANSIGSVKAAFAPYREKLVFMPVIENSTKESAIALLQEMISQRMDPAAIEIVFSNDQTSMLAPEVIAFAKQCDTRIWINSMWGSLNGGHHDAIGIGGNPDDSWGWILDHGGSVFQTDYADRLMEYLVKLGRRGGAKAPPEHSTVYDFHDGTLQGWTNQSPASGNTASFAADQTTFDGRTPAVTGAYRIVFEPFLTGRDGWHQTIVLRSPAFRLRGLMAHQTLAFSLLGGKGGATDAPATSADLPSAAHPGGFLGVALRRASDGRYLISARRSTNAQGHNWQRIIWNESQLAAATRNDSANESYTLDLIDSFGAAKTGGSLSWSWVSLDAVSIPCTATTRLARSVIFAQ